MPQPDFAQTSTPIEHSFRRALDLRLRLVYLPRKTSGSETAALAEGAAAFSGWGLLWLGAGFGVFHLVRMARVSAS